MMRHNLVTDPRLKNKGGARDSEHRDVESSTPVKPLASSTQTPGEPTIQQVLSTPARTQSPRSSISGGRPVENDPFSSAPTNISESSASVETLTHTPLSRQVGWNELRLSKQLATFKLDEMARISNFLFTLNLEKLDGEIEKLEKLKASRPSSRQELQQNIREFQQYIRELEQLDHDWKREDEQLEEILNSFKMERQIARSWFKK
jgi:hypothetical protein